MIVSKSAARSSGVPAWSELEVPSEQAAKENMTAAAVPLLNIVWIRIR
jgi:hypothetical protein